MLFFIFLFARAYCARVNGVKLTVASVCGTFLLRIRYDQLYAAKELVYIIFKLCLHGNLYDLGLCDEF